MNIYCCLSSGRGSWYLRFLQGVSWGKVFRGRRNTPRPQPRSSESFATNMAHGEIETMTYSPVCLASSQWPSPVDSWCALAHISPLVCHQSFWPVTRCQASHCLWSNPLKWCITEDRDSSEPKSGSGSVFPRLSSHCQDGFLCLQFPTSIKNGK